VKVRKPSTLFLFVGFAVALANFLYFAPGAHAAISVVQHAATSSAASANTLTIPINATGAGNLLIVAVGDDDAADSAPARTITGITDGTNSFTEVTGASSGQVTSGSGDQLMDMWYLPSSTAGKTSITITFSGSAGTFIKAGWVWEVSGITDPVVNAQAGGTTSGSSPREGVTLTTTAASTFVAAATFGDNITANPHAGNNCTAGGDTVLTGDTTGGAGCSLIAFAAGAYEPAWDDVGGSSRAVSMVAFKSASAAGIEFLQSTSTDLAAGAVSGSATFPYNVSKGDLLIVGVYDDLGATVTATDTLGDTFVEVASSTTPGNNDNLLFVATTTASGADTVTVSAGGGKNIYDAAIHEYSGTAMDSIKDMIDTSSTAAGSGTNVNSGDITTTDAGDLVFAWLTNANNSGADFTDNPDFIKRELAPGVTSFCNSQANCINSMDWITTSTVTTAATATLTFADGWDAMVLAFKPHGAPPTISSFAPSSSTITFGSSTALSWDTSNASSVAISGNNLSLSTSTATGTVSVTPNATGTLTYTLTATSVNGSTTATTSITVDTSVPAQPTSLATTNITTSTVSLSWASSTDSGGTLAGYIIYRCTGSCTPSAEIATSTGASYLDTGLATTTLYTYSVSAYNTTGDASASSSALVVMTAAGTGPFYPLKVSTSSRYLVGQDNTPFLMVGDSPQSVIAELSTSSADSYFADRAAHGFNTVWINLLCDDYTFCASDGETYDGIAPFTSGTASSSYDLSTPNPAYFARVDEMINLAAKHGLLVILDPIETGGWLSTLRNNGATKDFDYGEYVGNRYKNFPNIIWMNGNDFQTWNTSTTDNDAVVAVMHGLATADPNHLQTAELNYNVSSAYDDSTMLPYLSLNAAYTYYPTYAEVLHAYNQATAPVFMEEADYEGENNTGQDPSTPLVLRYEEYWTMLSGATGQLYGNYYTDRIANGWLSANIDTVGVTELGYMKSLFSSYAWYDLVPDQSSTVVTAGYGTFTDSGAVHSSDYVTAARTPDGNLIMAYLPASSTITVDMTKLSGAANAQWFDPTNDTFATISGSPFANTGSHQFATPGDNNSGDSDWVLVLKVAADTTPPSVTLTSPSSGATVSSSVTLTASSTDDVAVQGVQFQIDGANLGSEITATSGPTLYSTTWDTTGAPNGTHVISAIAYDTSNNTSTATTSVTVSNGSNTTPSSPSTSIGGAVRGGVSSFATVTVTSPSSNATLSGTATFSATAVPLAQVAHVWFAVDGTAVGSTLAAAPFTMLFDTAALAPGSHTLVAYANDAHGDTAASLPIAFTAGVAGGGAANASSSIPSLEATIAALQAELQTLLAEAGMSSAATPSSTAYVFTRNLGWGATGADVKQLQTFLIAQDKGPEAEKLASVGATGYLGLLTENALSEYQRAVGIVPAIGFFGPITRTKLNAL
jgi:hypothetical protein